MAMFQSVKQKIFTYFNPHSDQFDTATGTGTRRKRRFSEEEEDEDCQIVYPGKRQKQSYAPQQWNFRTLFDFVRGKVKTNPIPITTTANHTMYRDQTVQSSKPKHVQRTVLTPKRRSQSERKRTGLKQISNSDVFDLTQLDDDEDEVNEDLQLTKVSYDLSGSEYGENSIFLDNDTVTTPRSSSNPSHSTVKSPKSTPGSVFLTKSFRLDEKQRYKELLARFTDVRLPEYSESISPRRSPSMSPTTMPAIDLTDATAENINTSPLFYRKSFQKPVNIDLTRTELYSSRKSSSSKKYVDLTYVEPEVTFIEPEVSYVQPEIEVIEVAGKTKEKRRPKEVSAVLDLDWIRKWKETLDPIQLERERRIGEEERKCEVIKRKQLEDIEKLSKQGSEFPELDANALSKVKKSLAPGNSKDVFVEGFNAEITRGDIASLRNSTWLNDEVVNFYFNLVKSRSESDSNLPKVHVFNTFFYPKITKTGHAGVKRWTRKVDIFAVDVILIPVHLGMHWCLAVIDIKNKQIVYYDSLKGNNGSCINALKKYLSDESMDKKKTAFDFTGWTELMPKNIPEQMNGCDCGVFMCKYAEYKSRYADFTFTQDNMSYFRKRMIFEILSTKLM